MLITENEPTFALRQAARACPPQRIDLRCQTAVVCVASNASAPRYNRSIRIAAAGLPFAAPRGAARGTADSFTRFTGKKSEVLDITIRHFLNTTSAPRRRWRSRRYHRERRTHRDGRQHRQR